MYIFFFSRVAIFKQRMIIFLYYIETVALSKGNFR